MLTTSTPAGLHDFIIAQALPDYMTPGTRAVDLGAGSGAMAARLQEAGCDVLAVDMNRAGYGGDGAFEQVDLNRDFSARLGNGSFGLVTAVEVIEHMESPIGFLRNIGELLGPGGIAVVTTPNVDNAPARVKFLLRGKIRTMDETSEPTHISPIFWDLFVRQYLPRSNMKLITHYLFPRTGFSFTRPAYAMVFRALSHLLRGRCLLGDNHVFVLQRAGPESQPVS